MGLLLGISFLNIDMYVLDIVDYHPIRHTYLLKWKRQIQQECANASMFLVPVYYGIQQQILYVSQVKSNPRYDGIQYIVVSPTK